MKTTEHETALADLSALIDGELAADEARFLLRRLEHEPELRAAYGRWHLQRAVLQGRPIRMPRQCLVDRVQEQIASEAQGATGQRRVHGLLRAAAVVGVALVASQAYWLSQPRAPEASAVAATIPTELRSSPLDLAAPVEQAAVAIREPQLSAYLIEQARAQSRGHDERLLTVPFAAPVALSNQTRPAAEEGDATR